MNFPRAANALLLCLCSLFFLGCGGSRSNDTPESLMTEGITLFTAMITDLENGMSAEDAEKKYGTQVKDYNTRCQSISPSEEVRKKLFKEHFKTMMDLDKRFVNSGMGKGLPPKVLIGYWKKSE